MYITDLLSMKPAANYALSSSAKSLLFVPKVNCSTLGDLAFAPAAPALNFLFKKAFNLLE